MAKHDQQRWQTGSKTMRALTNVPLLIVPFIAYNLVALRLVATESEDPWETVVMELGMISGATWSMNLGDLMIVLGLFLLFFEILKATRISNHTIIDHLLSTFVFVAYLVEFLLVSAAAHSVFFVLMAITFLDVVAGFAVSIRSATRDVSVGGSH
ncbi:MAG: hypothetical protein BroJett030_03300 [Alphaproteobacteria bacterium]|nr:MAG: hypothetical protein BroJett030_03300 [Alphaproteobacteria bacterium]